MDSGHDLEISCPSPVLLENPDVDVLFNYKYGQQASKTLSLATCFYGGISPPFAAGILLTCRGIL
jgi:hypothetical protein